MSGDPVVRRLPGDEDTYAYYEEAVPRAEFRPLHRFSFERDELGGRRQDQVVDRLLTYLEPGDTDIALVPEWHYGALLDADRPEEMGEIDLALIDADAGWLHGIEVKGKKVGYHDRQTITRDALQYGAETIDRFRSRLRAAEWAVTGSIAVYREQAEGNEVDVTVYGVIPREVEA